MQTLNALDAISPAIARTKLVLFSPFGLGRTWKLSMTGYLAFTATFFMPFPLIYFGFVPSLLHSGRMKEAAFVIAGITVMTLLFMLVFYACSRLEFAFFDIVLNRGEFVAPAWRKYGAQTWPWIAIKVALGAALTLALEAPLVGIMHRGIHFMRMMKPGQPPPAGFNFAILKFELGIFTLFGALFLIGSLLTDFVLPSLALENASVAESLRRFLRLIKREPGQIIGFIFMKIALGIGGYIAQMIFFYILLLVFIIVLAIVFGIGFLVLHVMHVPTAVILVLGFIVGMLAYLFFIFYMQLGLLGVLLTFLQAYALYFLGGRYPLIGIGLERSTPPPGYSPLGYPPPMPWPYAPPPSFNPPTP